jgi:hypothetical protein
MSRLSFKEMKAKWSDPDYARHEREFRAFLKQHREEDIENRQMVADAVASGRWVEPTVVPDIAWHHTILGFMGIMESGEIHFGTDTSDETRRRVFSQRYSNPKIVDYVVAKHSGTVPRVWFSTNQLQENIVKLSINPKDVGAIQCRFGVPTQSLEKWYPEMSGSPVASRPLLLAKAIDANANPHEWYFSREKVTEDLWVAVQRYDYDKNEWTDIRDRDGRSWQDTMRLDKKGAA